jgi:hypothetical protein
MQKVLRFLSFLKAELTFPATTELYPLHLVVDSVAKNSHLWGGVRNMSFFFSLICWGGGGVLLIFKK